MRLQTTFFAWVNLLRKKLLEESQELIEAEDVDHVAAEAADVIYFALVRVVAAGASLNDIEKHLDERSLKVSRRTLSAENALMGFGSGIRVGVSASLSHPCAISPRTGK